MLTIADFGGVEVVAANVARAMQRAGFRTTICMIGQRPIMLPTCLQSAFDDRVWFPEPNLVQFNGPHYEGTHIPQNPAWDVHQDLTGLLSGFDAVISCHSAGAMTVLGTLRRRGVVTVLHEHVLDMGDNGRTYGTPVMALAYEGAVDFIATCSRTLRDWFGAHGVPEAKLVCVPNAPGYPIPKDDVAIALRRKRLSRESSRRLRALFLGRLDHQKGLDRLISLIAKLDDSGTAVDWKVVGKSIVDDDVQIDSLKARLTILPAVYSAAERTTLYEWADIVVLLSRFEGLPLTVLEAQRCGAVPIVTRVGAVSEAVRDGVDGYMVDPTNCVNEMHDLIRRLAQNAAVLNRMSEAASAKDLNWDVSAAPLVEKLRGEILSRSKWRTVGGMDRATTTAAGTSIKMHLVE